MEIRIKSVESPFCVRDRLGKENLDCPCSEGDAVPFLRSLELPKLPSFDCSTTTALTTDLTEATTFTSKKHVSQSISTTTNKIASATGVNEYQGCCEPNIFVVLAVIFAIILLILLLVICIRYRRGRKLHAKKYHTSSGNGPVASDINKVEEANGTKIQNTAEAVPLRSHNWVGSTPNSSKPNIPQSQSAEPLGLSELASVVKTPSDPHLMVDEGPQVQDLQTQPSQVELLSKDAD